MHVVGHCIAKHCIALRLQIIFIDLAAQHIKITQRLIDQSSIIGIAIGKLLYCIVL